MYTLVHYMHPVLVDQYQITTNNSDSGFIPSLCLEPWAKHKNVTTIETWLSIFHVFLGPYTKQFPHEIRGDNSGLGYEGPQREFSFSEASTPCCSSVGSNPW